MPSRVTVFFIYLAECWRKQTIWTFPLCVRFCMMNITVHTVRFFIGRIELTSMRNSYSCRYRSFWSPRAFFYCSSFNSILRYYLQNKLITKFIFCQNSSVIFRLNPVVQNSFFIQQHYIHDCTSINYIFVQFCQMLGNTFLIFFPKEAFRSIVCSIVVRSYKCYCSLTFRSFFKDRLLSAFLKYSVCYKYIMLDLLTLQPQH